MLEIVPACTAVTQTTLTSCHEHKDASTCLSSYHEGNHSDPCVWCVNDWCDRDHKLTQCETSSHMTKEHIHTKDVICDCIQGEERQVSPRLNPGAAVKMTAGERQITPAFTPVSAEPAAVPDIRYPVPPADRYPLGAGYVWPSANYGTQYGGPYRGFE